MTRRVDRSTLSAVADGQEISKTYESPDVALSAALTVALRASTETTVYVRDADEKPYGRVERHADGVVYVHRVADGKPLRYVET